MHSRLALLWVGAICCGIFVIDNTSRFPRDRNRVIDSDSATGAASALDAQPVLRAEVTQAPRIILPVLTQRTPSNTPLVFSTTGGNTISVSNDDAGLGELFVWLGVEHGTLTLTTTNGLTMMRGANGSASMTFTGTLAAANAALDGLTFSPPTGFAGPVTLSVSVNDQGHTGVGGPQSDSETRILAVGVYAQNDAYTVAHGKPLSIPAHGVLSNDSNPDALTATLFSGPTQGRLTLKSDGSFVYQPATPFVGTDRFTYTAHDPQGRSATATVRVTVVNSAPVARADIYGVHASQPFFVDASRGLLRNDVDEEGNTLTAELIGPVSCGYVGINPDGSFAYYPLPGFTGIVNFSYRALDGLAYSDPVNVQLFIHATNAAPVAEDDAFVIHVNSSLVLHPTLGILDNDTDADGDVLTVSMLSDPQHGTLSWQPDGHLTYVPTPSFVGVDRVTYSISDGKASNVATLTIFVENAVPVAAAHSYDVHAGTTLSVASSSGLLIMSHDPDEIDNYKLTAELVTPPVVGSLVVYPNGSFDFTPPTGFMGTTTFTYQVCDAVAASAPALVTIVVRKAEPIVPVEVDVRTGAEGQQ